MPRPIDTIPGMAPVRTVTGNDETDTFLVTVQPPAFTGLPASSVELTRDQYIRYVKWRAGGVLIQDVLYDLDVDQLEILISGIGKEDFARLAADDEE